MTDRQTDRLTASNQKNPKVTFVTFYDITYNNEGNYPLILGELTGTLLPLGHQSRISHILRSLKDLSCVQNDPQIISILNFMNLAQILSSYVTEVHFNNTLPSTKGLPGCLFLSGFPTNALYAFFFSPHVMCLLLGVHNCRFAWSPWRPICHGGSYYSWVPSMELVSCRPFILGMANRLLEIFCISALTFLPLYLQAIITFGKNEEL